MASVQVDEEEVVINGDVHKAKLAGGESTLEGLLRRASSTVFYPGEAPILHRVRTAFSENAPLVREASANSSKRVLRWTHRGSPLRALLVISVGTITLLSFTGLLVFMLFFVTATVNAIVIIGIFISHLQLPMWDSLQHVPSNEAHLADICTDSTLPLVFSNEGRASTMGHRGFLALFFVCVTAVFIGELSVAVFVISATTISAIIAIIIATGWIGFFWSIWLVTKKSIGVAKHSTGTAISAYSSGT